MRKPDLMSKDWNLMDEQQRSKACRQLFYEESHRSGNRKEPGTGAIIPWSVEELYQYSKEHKISNDEIERIFKEVK